MASCSSAKAPCASSTATILDLDDDVLMLFGAAVEEESGMPAVAAFAATCKMFARLLQPRASAMKKEAEEDLGERLGLNKTGLDQLQRQLKCRACGINDVDCQLLAQWLRPGGPLEPLESLDFTAPPTQPVAIALGGPAARRPFGLPGARALAAVVSQLPSLSLLKLEGDTPVPMELVRGTASRLNLAPFGLRTAALLGSLAAENPKLRTVQMGRKMGTAAQLPARELRGEGGVQKLDLSSKFLDSTAGVFVGAMLGHNATLVWLDLSHNFEPCAGRGGAMWASSVAHGLRGATALRTLKLRFCGLGAEGGAAIAYALRTTRSLTLLDLRDNALLSPVELLDANKQERSSSVAIRALIAALPVNAKLATPLANLKLGGNYLGSQALARLQAAAHPELKISSA